MTGTSALPDPPGALSGAVERAAGELAGIASADPAARSAIFAVRLAHHTLTSFWLPALSFDDGRPGA